MEIRDLADELQAILDGERPRLNKAEMREYLECLRAFAPIAAQDEAVLEIGECAEVIWHQGGPCQLPPGAKLYPRSEPKYIEEIAEALGDPTLISLSQVATGIRDLKAERARVPDVPSEWDARSLDRCCTELTNLVNLADDYQFDEATTQAFQTSIECIRLCESTLAMSQPGQAMETVRPWPKFVQDECLEVLRNMDTELSARGRKSARIERLINAIAGMPANG